VAELRGITVSVKVVAELNPYSSQRSTVVTDSGSINDIIEKLNSGFPPAQARVCRNGEIIKDFSTIANDGDTLWVKFVPYGESPRQTGGYMKLGGYALTIAGFIIGVAAGWTGVGAGVGAALIGAGVGMLAGGTALLNINIPSFKDREKPDQDPSIRGGKNQMRPGGRIPVLFGRHRIYPDLAANPHTEIIGNAQYFTQLFCGGYKECEIDKNSFKLGDTPLVDLSETEDINQILANADPLVRLEIIQDGGKSSLYPYCVHEDMLNAELKHEVEGGNGNKILGEIIRETPDKTDKINVDIFFYNGLGEYNDKGDLVTAAIEVVASYKKADDDSPNWTPLGFFDDANKTNTLSGSDLKTKRYQVTKEGLEPYKYKVKIERVTTDSTSSKIIDQVYVGSIRSTKSESPISAGRRGNLTIIAMRLMATAKVSGVVDSFNYIATSKLPVYTAGGSGALRWLTVKETRNPASILLHVLRGNAAQQRVDHEDIDWASLETFYQWCEEKDEDGNYKYTCDAYLSESVTMAEILRMICGTARAEALRIDSKISVVQDITRPSPVQLFTPKNTKGYSIAMFNADIPDAVSLRYIDEKSGYAQSELSVYNTPGGNPPENKSPDTIQKIDLWGVTNSAQVRRIGMYNYACLKNRPFVHTIEVDIEYLLCNKGDRIQYAGDIALTGSVQGRINGLVFNEDICIGVRVDEPVETEPGKQYAVRIRKSDGTVLLKDITAVQHPNVIFFSEPFNKNDMPREGDVYAFGVRGYEVIDLIITDIQPQADLSATLTCVEYSPEIFKVDDPDFKLPEFENKITPVSGAVDPGVVGPVRWRLFVIFHDGDEEPLRPTGDGQGDGWHYAQTLLSVWQSSKTAESVDSGEWGAPIRIKNFRSDTDVVPVWLTLSPQNKILDCDSFGNIITGLLPFTSQAALFKWNHQLPLVAGIQRFPGNGVDLFDPMLGDFVPTDNGITFYLQNAPQGVSIDYKGMITVSKNAVLDVEHIIIVKAEYEGAVYSEKLFIQVKKRVGENNYLGTVETLTLNNPNVTIVKGNPKNGKLTAIQGSYVLSVASGTVGVNIWKAGYIYQWSGLAWEERDINDYTDLYLSCYKDGLDVKELAGDTKWFGGLIAKMLIAQKAFIETLETQLLKITGVIYGGDRFDEHGQEINKNADGWYLGPDGRLQAAGGRFSGTVYAQGGHFKEASAEELSISGGSIRIGSLFVSDDVTTPSRPATYLSTTKLIAFVNNYLPNIPVSGDITFQLVIYYGGKYGSSDLYSIELNKGWVSISSGQTGGNYLNYSAIFNTSSGRKVVSAMDYETNVTIGQQVYIEGGGAGTTFQLTGLPEVDPRDAGKLYRNPSGQLFVSLG
jgi:hypothetical protein